ALATAEHSNGQQYPLPVRRFSVGNAPAGFAHVDAMTSAADSSIACPMSIASSTGAADGLRDVGHAFRYHLCPLEVCVTDQGTNLLKQEQTSGIFNSPRSQHHTAFRKLSARNPRDFPRMWEWAYSPNFRISTAERFRDILPYGEAGVAMPALQDQSSFIYS